MIDFTIETEIARPVSAVFAHVTDPSKLASWQTSTVSAIQEDDGPLGLGTRLREIHRTPGGKEFASRVEVSEYEPDRTFALHMIEGALPLDARITFESTEHGTRIRFHAYGQPTGAMRVAQPLLRRSLKRQFARDCATLKRVLENPTDAASGQVIQADTGERPLQSDPGFVGLEFEQRFADEDARA
jgi:uncharacterized protein YndB with AHSA1/START domain